MAIYLDEAKPLTVYRGKFNYPINKNDRLHNAIVYLITPSLDGSIDLLNSPLSYNNHLNYQSYFLEKNIQFILNNKLSESNTITINDEEVFYDHNIINGLNLYSNDDISINEDCLSIGNEYRIYYNDSVLLEDSETTLKNLLIRNRIKNQKEILNIYDDIKKKVDSIKYTFTDPKLYKNRNLYYDWSHYLSIFFNNKEIMGNKGLDVFSIFINRLLRDNRFNDYTKRTIVIPIHQWISREDNNPFDYRKSITPISLLYYDMKNKVDMSAYSNSLLVFLTNTSFFVMDTQYMSNNDINKFMTCVKRLQIDDHRENEEIKVDSKLVIMNHLADRFTKSGIEINNLNSEELEDKEEIDTNNPEVKKAMLVNKLEKIAEKNTNVDNAIDNLDKEDEDDEQIKELLIDIQADSGIKMNKARTERYNKMQQEFLKKDIRGKSIAQLMKQFESNDNIPESSIPIDSIDEHWHKVKFPNFNEVYTKEDMDADIVAMFNHFTKVTHPMNIVKLDVENTSTSEDYVDTWTCEYEDAETGKRSTMKLDLPRLIGNRFMKLRGNEKKLQGQLILLPIIKTDVDTAQIVSNYNKIFIRRKSPSGNGKASVIVNKMAKVLNKYKGREFKVTKGDNTKVSHKYPLPIAFEDLSSLFSSIRFPDGSYVSFNMDNLKPMEWNRSKLPKADAKLTTDALMSKYMGIYVVNGKKEPIIDQNVDEYLLDLMCTKSKDFVNEYNNTPASKRLMYSEASILNMRIPLIIIIAYALGLQKALDVIGIKYEFSETRPKKFEAYLKFTDGYLKYEPRNEADNLLMNGLAQVDTDNFSIREVNSKDMWLTVLDDYGGRVKADGLDNFYDLMMDPITVEVCKILKIPYNYIDALIYASSLLVDTKFNRHSDITGNRLRVNEIIVGHLYSVLAKEYGAYRNLVKRNASAASFTCKKSAVIDSILTHDQTSSDLSTLTPLLEAETATEVTFKGLSGLNSERAFSMEKRTYDKSMLGVLGLSTGFAGTVGINRHTTVDAGVINKRGFIAPKDPSKLDCLSTYSIMEAMSPLTVNRNDPMRTAMAFTQTVQHMMTVKKSMPNLITTGADEALPYLTSDKFSYKFKGNKGTVLEVTDDYIIIQDDQTKECDYIDLRETIQKNSDGGFFVTTKLDANKGIRKGSKLKKNDIVAYNKLNYSPAIGNGNHNDPNALSYNVGTLAKIAIYNTAMGFEDSCTVDSYLSRALATDLVVQKEVDLPAESNVYSIVNIGDAVEEGEPLLIFSENFEDEDANAILRNLSKDSAILSDIGRKQVHSKVSGHIQDIKIYRTVELDKLNPTLQAIVKKYENKSNQYKKVMRKYKIDKEYELEPTDKLPMEGKLKGTEGVKIEFYIKTVDRYGVGDKLTFEAGLKGVCSSIIPEGKEATSEYRPKEFVSGFLTSTGAFGRMCVSQLLNGYIAKGLIELTRQIQDELGIKWRNIQDIMIEGLED